MDDQAKKICLWLAALAIVGFAFLSAVNATKYVAGVYGVTSGGSYCGGFDSLGDWFSGQSACEDLLPARLGIIVAGLGLALIPIYFAQRKRPANVRVSAAPTQQASNVPRRPEANVQRSAAVSASPTPGAVAPGSGQPQPLSALVPRNRTSRPVTR